MGHLRTPAKFKKSSQQRSNLLLSPKLQRQAKEQKKEKWSFINSNFQPRISPLERLSREFALEWKMKQSLKAHFFIQGDNKQNKFKDYSEKKATTFSKLIKKTQKKNIVKSSKINLFLALWESRLDICLWKGHLLPSISMSREFIHSGFVQVNGKQVKKQSKLLKKGDFVEIDFLKNQNNKVTPSGYKFILIKERSQETREQLPLSKNSYCFAANYHRIFSLNTFKKNINLNSKNDFKVYNRLLAKNLLQYTLFFQKSGLDYTSFFIPKVEEKLFEKVKILSSPFYITMIIKKGFLSSTSTKNNYLTTSNFLHGIDLNIPSSSAQIKTQNKSLPLGFSKCKFTLTKVGYLRILLIFLLLRQDIHRFKRKEAHLNSGRIIP